MISAVLDVNVLISAILAPHGTPGLLLSRWQAGQFTVLVSEGIIAEVEAKLRQPRTGGAYGVTEGDIVSIGLLLRTRGEMVSVLPRAVVGVTGDPEDDYVLATAAIAGADWLVTGDRRLRSLNEHRGVTILTPREFLTVLEVQFPD